MMFSLAFVVLVLADGSLSLRVSMNVLPLRSLRTALKKTFIWTLFIQDVHHMSLLKQDTFHDHLTSADLCWPLSGAYESLSFSSLFFQSIKSSRMCHWLHDYLIRSTDIRAILTWYSHMIKLFILQTKFKVNNLTKYINFLWIAG